MKNKYIWVVFNLVASLLALVFLLNLDFSGLSVSNDASLVILIAYGSVGCWVYKTIVYWRLCIQADDPNFDLAVRSKEN